jgi:hypothetical protein
VSWKFDGNATDGNNVTTKGYISNKIFWVTSHVNLNISPTFQRPSLAPSSENYHDHSLMVEAEKISKTMDLHFESVSHPRRFFIT